MADPRPHPDPVGRVSIPAEGSPTDSPTTDPRPHQDPVGRVSIPAAEGTRKKSWGRWLRLVLGLAALGYLLWRIDLAEAARVLAQANLWLLGAALALTVLAMVGLTAVRWSRLLSAQAAPPLNPPRTVHGGEEEVSLARLVRHYLVGYFYNMFLPGAIGGDIYRVLKLGQETGSPSGALAAVAAERLLGLVALLPVGLIGFALLPVRLAGQREFIAVLAALAAVLLSAPAWLRPRVLRLFRAPYRRIVDLRPLRRFRLDERLARLYSALAVYLDRPQALLAPFALSLLSRAVWVAAAYLTGLALGVRLGYAHYMAVLAITELVRMLPISLGGIGVREGAFVVLLAPFGVPREQAFMLSALFYLMLMTLGLVGGIVYVYQTAREHRAQP